MKQDQALSIVVPTLNEAENIPSLLSRIDGSLTPAGIVYEVIVIDDHSSDATLAIADELSLKYPVRTFLKQGERGKAYSLLEGFEHAYAPVIAMIDADLQYAPEELPAMYKLLVEKNADIVITERQEKKVNPLRKLSTGVFHFFFARLLFGIEFDTQSGLKLFRSKVLDGLTLDPTPWTFDLEFLVRALEQKRTIISHGITFSERTAGVTKIKLLSSTWEFVKASLKLRWRTSARKTRAGYRANSRFLKRAFPATVVAVVCALSMLGAKAHSASALSLNQPSSVLSSLPVTASILGDVKGVLTSPPAAQVTSPQAPGTANTKSPSAASPATGSAASATAAPASGSGVTQASSQTTTINLSDGTSATPTVTLAGADRSKLSAATGSDGGNNVYGSGYPYYELNNDSTHKLTNAARIAWSAGALCIATVILVAGSRLTRAYAANKIQRS